MSTSTRKSRPVADCALSLRLMIFLILIGSSITGCSASKSQESNHSKSSAKIQNDEAAVTALGSEFQRKGSGTRVDTLQSFSISNMERSRGACVFFVGTDCPISNAYAPEIARIVTEFEKYGIAFYFIYAMRDLEPQKAAEHAKSYGFRGQVILDGELSLAKALGATRMPEALLLPSFGEAVYQGRIDDRYPAPGAKRREHPQNHDLRDALEAFVAGKRIANSRTDAVGCYLDLP